MQAQPEPARIECLDAMRGLAALAVVAGHFIAAYGHPPGVPVALLQTPLAALINGEASVSFFFVLSGFVLSVGYFRDPRRLHEQFSYGGYMVARVLRLWLPFAAVFLVTWAMRVWIYSPATESAGYSAWLSEFWRLPPSLGDGLTELSLVLPPQRHQLIPPGWTLTIELSLSLFVPAAALIAERRLWWLAALVGYGIIAIGMPRYGFHFLLGIVISRLWVTRGTQFRERRPLLRSALWIAGALLYTYRDSIRPYLPDVVPEGRVWYVTGIGAAIILTLVLGSPMLQRPLSHPALRFLGRCSYSIYLVHFTLLMVVMPPIMRALARGQDQVPASAWYVGFAAMLAITVGSAAVSERALERPSIAWGRRWLHGRPAKE